MNLKKLYTYHCIFIREFEKSPLMAQAFTLVPLQSIVVSELPKFRGKPPQIACISRLVLHLTKNKQTKFINGNTEKFDLGKFARLQKQKLQHLKNNRQRQSPKGTKHKLTN